MYSPFRHSASENGPVPIISCVSRSSFPLANASETTEELNMAMSERKGAHGSLSFMTTVVSSCAMTSWSAVRTKVQVPLGSFFARSTENLTSRAVIGVPSENITPGRR